MPKLPTMGLREQVRFIGVPSLVHLISAAISSTNKKR